MNSFKLELRSQFTLKEYSYRNFTPFSILTADRSVINSYPSVNRIDLIRKWAGL